MLSAGRLDLFLRGPGLAGVAMRRWRNRNTPQSQKLLPARACGFESHPPHSKETLRSEKEIAEVRALDRTLPI
jgi:hypothetical protein